MKNKIIWASVAERAVRYVYYETNDWTWKAAIVRHTYRTVNTRPHSRTHPITHSHLHIFFLQIERHNTKRSKKKKESM